MAPRTEPQSGFALLAALVMAMAAGGIVLVMSVTSMSSHRLSQQQVLSVQARYLAEGSIEIAKQVILEAVARGDAPPAGGTADIDGIDVPYSITAVDPPNVVTDPSGIQTTIQSYEVGATTSIGGVRGTAGRIVNAETTPLFQYAVFFEQSLDILPTPNMVITGRIHTNGDLRVGCNSSSTVTLDTNYIRAVGDLRRWELHSNTPTVGDVLIRKWVEDPFNPVEPVVYEELESYDQMTALGVPSTTGYDSQFDGYDINSDGTYDTGAGDWLPFDAGVLERYEQPSAYLENGSTMLLGVHGVGRSAPPPAGSRAMFEPVSAGDYEWDGSEYVPVPVGTGTHSKGFFHGNADVAITVAADGSSWVARDAGGLDVSASLSGVVTIDQTYDKRQGGFVPVAKIDIAALNASTEFPSNGLLYVGHYGMGTGTDSKGVHLVNGSDVASGLTVVTEGSAYIQGDYNTVDKVPAAVISDAVNLLSNSWTNTTTEPTASATTYNVALVTGNTETIPGQYNGGLENYPRFHEDWDEVTCTVVGSMISAWENQYATGTLSDAQYSPPDRNYGYDVDFNDVTQLPPFTPMSATVIDVVSW